MNFSKVASTAKLDFKCHISIVGHQTFYFDNKITAAVTYRAIIALSFYETTKNI